MDDEKLIRLIEKSEMLKKDIDKLQSVVNTTMFYATVGRMNKTLIIYVPVAKAKIIGLKSGDKVRVFLQKTVEKSVAGDRAK